MRFDLHYDDGPNGPRWQLIIILIVLGTVVLAVVVLAVVVLGWSEILATYRG
jgi:flagellar basal body-associated protein FliL